MERLDKFLCDSGVGTRSQVKGILKAGRVTVDGKPYGAYPLSEELTLDIRTGDGGEQLNRLIIREGQAFVETATCPDGICAAHKPISRDGESIVCLPHRVVITVESADTPRSDKQPDVVP